MNWKVVVTVLHFTTPGWASAEDFVAYVASTNCISAANTHRATAASISSNGLIGFFDKSQDIGTMKTQNYRARRLKESKKYLAAAGLATILAAATTLLINHLSSAAEVVTSEAAPIMNAIGERNSSETIDSAALVALAAGALLTYLGRETT